MRSVTYDGDFALGETGKTDVCFSHRLNDDEDDLRLLLVIGFIAHLPLIFHVRLMMHIFHEFSADTGILNKDSWHGIHDMFTLSMYENYVRSLFFSIEINGFEELPLVCLP